MFFLFVLLCLFGSSVQCAKRLPEDRDSLVILALNMQNVDTGYPDEPYTETDIKNSQVVWLKQFIKAKLDRLFCRYVFSAINHMQLTQTLFQSPMGAEQIECIASFKDVAVDMIDTLYGLSDQDFDGLWLFNVYTNELPTYFKSVTTGDGPMSVELADKLSNKQHMVTMYLKYSWFACPCTDWKQLENTSADYFANLKSVKTLMANNRQHGVVANDSNNIFKPSQLYLNDVVVDDHLMAGLQLLLSDLQIDWSAFYVGLTKLNAKAHDFLSLGHGTKSIDAYHDFLFDFLELVILRFARKHVFSTLYDFQSRRFLSSVIFDLPGSYGAGNAIMSNQTAAMMQMFQIDNEWLDKFILMLRETVSPNNWKTMQVAGQQEEERIINKHDGGVNATEIKLNHTVGLGIFQSVLKLASSRGITTTDDTPDLANNAISPVQINLMTMDITYKYCANVLFKDIDFGVLGLFRKRNKKNNLVNKTQ